MAAVQVKELIAAGVHFGHRTSRWNPKMAPYIFGKRNLIHIIDLKETIKGLIRARRFLARVAAEGEHILFVGTKRQARETVEREAKRAGCPFVAQRWLGGCLTNFRTIRSRLSRLLELERLEETGEINAYSKKMIASLRREKRKMLRNLDGIRTLDRLPGALVVVDPRHEHIAVREALKLDIPTVALIDTDCDPDLVTLVVPGNDDSMRSIEIFLREVADAVLEGKALRASQPPGEDRPRGGVWRGMDTIAHPLPHPPVLQQTGVFQIAQVTGGLGLGDPEHRHEVAHTQVGVRQQETQHGEAGLV